jgi:hypothetical protein
MTRLLVLWLAFVLAGCDSGRRQEQLGQEQLAKCVFDAETDYPDTTWLAGDARQSYVWLCMAAHGYILNRGQQACARAIPAEADAVLYVQCYEPSGRLPAAFYRMETMLRR